MLRNLIPSRIKKAIAAQEGRDVIESFINLGEQTDVCKNPR